MTAATAPPAVEPTRAKQLARLVHEHQPTVWRLLRFLGADPAEADDLTQETFLAVARSNFEENSVRQTSAYLRTVARNQLLMLRRSQRRQISTVELEAAESVWADQVEHAGWDAMTDTLRDCVEKLDGRAAQAIKLCYTQGESRDAIAETLGMKADGVKTLLRRTRDVLRECVERNLERNQ